MTVLLFLIVLYILLGLSMMRLFEKAGIPSWKALVPGLAAIEWAKMVGRKPSYAIWLLFPVVNLFIYAALCVDMVRSFGKYSFGQAALAVIYAPIPFFLIGRHENDRYEGAVLPRERAYYAKLHEAMDKRDKTAVAKLAANSPFHKSSLREWGESLIFAAFAAGAIHMFIAQPYQIPTSSMEGSLKVGDYLLVSKLHYGLRTPITVLQFPMLHNRFFSSGKVLNCESYISKPSLPYFRLPAITKLERNDPVVFNYPTGDSIVIFPNRSFDVYQLRRMRQAFPPDKVISRPVDKKDPYVKRCIATPGDTLQIIDGQVYINGQAITNPTHMQFAYHVSSKTGPINLKKIEELGVNIYDCDRTGDSPGAGARRGDFHLDATQVEAIQEIDPGIQIERTAQPKLPGMLFPYDANRCKNWSVDNYGPIYIPQKNATTELNMENIAYYERIIQVYEGNQLEIKDGKIFINSQEASSYTFQKDYYWMMGDNRHNSEDSRFWGYVPEDHILGKPLFIFFSTKNASMRNGINWDRFFRSAGSM